MICKAIFLIGLVVLLTPHEPDLGLGRPSAFTFVSAAPQQDCAAPQQIESLMLNIPHALNSFRDDFLRQAPQIRAEIRDSLNSRKLDAAAPSQDGASGSHFFGGG